MEKKIGITIDNSNEAFYATQATVHFSPSDFCIDFGQVTPRMNVTPKGGEMSYVNKHNTIVISPGLAKQLVELLGRQVKKFEKDVGKIRPLKKSKKKSLKKKPTVSSTTKYIG